MISSSSNVPPFILAFFHVYKCGGSTFNQILESNFPGEVLYAESHDHILSDQSLGRPRRRLEKKPLEIFLESNTHYRSLSSHLASQDLAAMALQAVTIIRNPYSRMLSSYLFDQLLGNISVETGFNEYAYCRNNTMSKRLFAGQPAQYNLFYGVLEMFDESMVLLEYIMYVKHGVQLDLSYALLLNKSSLHCKNPYLVGQFEEFKCENSADYEIFDKAKKYIISSSKSIRQWSRLVSDFKRRKQNRLKHITNAEMPPIAPGNDPAQCILI